jgi:ADP-ribose pyrophosphatase YjhB (NUDIX family)
MARDTDGRILLVRQADTGEWSTVGGTIEIGEPPEDAAIREAKEEIGVDVALVRLIGCFGGAGFEVTYANGDHAAFVSAVYEATLGGVPKADMEEVVEIGWFDRDALGELALSPFTTALLRALGDLR